MDRSHITAPLIAVLVLSPYLTESKGEIIEDKAAPPTSKGTQMAEEDPVAFIGFLRKRLLEELIKETDRGSCASIAKYEPFVANIRNEATRVLAQEMLEDLKKNYSRTWHLLYPIPLADGWEVKGNPVVGVEPAIDPRYLNGNARRPIVPGDLGMLSAIETRSARVNMPSVEMTRCSAGSGKEPRRLQSAFGAGEEDPV